MQLIEKFFSSDAYRISRYAEVSLAEKLSYRADMDMRKPSRKFKTVARPAGYFRSDGRGVERDVVQQKHNTVVVSALVEQQQTKRKLLELVAQHVKDNIVKIGRKYYRQRMGITQGSVLSSLLCNIFYADFELQALPFLDKSRSLLLRLIDDFLLITTDQSQANQFLDVMYRGDARYGLAVRRDKTLVNFDVAIEGESIRKPSDLNVFLTAE